MKKAILSVVFVVSIAVSVYVSKDELQRLWQQQNMIDSAAKGSTFLGFDAEKDISHAFIQFIAKYGKTYASHSDTNSKYNVFKDNYLKIQSNNQNNPGFKQGINKFSDLTEEEFLEIYGTLQENSGAQSHPMLSRGLKKNSDERYQDYHEPEDHDFFDYNNYNYIDRNRRCINKNWLEEGKVGIPKDQSTCGSCWAHSTIASVETLYGIVNKITDSSKIPSFSEQQLVDCNFLPNLGCLGGRRQYAFNYTLSYGLTTSDKYPYRNEQGECTYDEKTDKVFQIDEFKAYERMRNADLEKLVCQGTVSVSIRINDCVKNYQSGILYDGDGLCGCSKIPSTNHAVAIVGFGVDDSNPICQKYWLAKNSWGPNWGEGGFFRLCREDNELQFGTCNIRYEPMIALKYQ